MKSLPLERFESLSPERFKEYLKNKNWQKHKEIANVLSIWVYVRGKDKIGLLLPLDPELVDFSKRMAEAVDVLAEVEQLSQEEILLALESPVRVASKEKREILNIKISDLYDKEKREVAAKNIGLVFKSFQDLIDVFGEFNPRRYSSKIQALKNLELSFKRVYGGSFGVQVAFPSDQQPDIYGNNIAEKVSQEFFDLVKASNEENVNRFKEMLLGYKGNPSKKIKSFFSKLATLEANIDFDWGATNPENSERASIDYANILRAIEVISKIELEEIIEFTIIGRLRVAGEGKSKKERQFLLKDIEDDVIYEGIIDQKVLEDESIELIIGKVYEATLQEETSKDSSDAEIKKYTLVGLELRSA
ncbi:MAG: hypothetical protein J7647_19010 [Cyanobacteria bacterium SBLK]|nr:hypothetical protein [Cyanobacteria bacterium SBLK]